MTDILKDLSDKYELVNYGHAAEIIKYAYDHEWQDLSTILKSFSICTTDIVSAGGSETAISGQLERLFSNQGWKNTLVKAKLRVSYYERIAGAKSYSDIPYASHDENDFVNGVHVDYLKNGVAVCVEWNKKDVSYDRVIAALRSFFELKLIGAGVIITRSDDLDVIFRTLTDKQGNSIRGKYGASTTHMGRLIPRLDSGQAGGCPVLLVGITRKCVIDL